MTHLDLFSGIGGFALASEAIWPAIKHTFVEYDPFCQAVLRKHWPQAEIHGDIRTFITDTERLGYVHGKSQEQSAKSHLEALGQPATDFYPPFILTGGFPCQPFSQAGRRKGTADNRYLWPEMFRVIQLTNPTWVIAENVRGLVTWNDGLVLEQVCADLESEGYEVQPLIIPAVAVNAPHRRDRIWFIAFNTKHDGRNGSQDGQGSVTRGDSNTTRENEDEQPARPTLSRDDVKDSLSQRSGGWGKNSRQILGCQSTEVENARSTWSSHWTEVATELCSMDDGLSVGLGKLKLSKAKHRNEQIKAYGNAIVPQVAVEIMKSFSSPTRL